MNNTLLTLFDLTVSILFILSLRGLAFPQTAYRSNLLGIIGMAAAIIAALFGAAHLIPILGAVALGAGIGIFVARKVQMTGLPQTVAFFNGLGGLAAFLVACCAVIKSNPDSFDTPAGAAVGIFTFSGSFIAFAKLHGLIKHNSGRYGQYLSILLAAALAGYFIIYAIQPETLHFVILSTLAFVLGITVTMHIGGADMPIVISLLNAGSGLAAAAVGFILGSPLLIITGALVGAGGSILSYVMCKAMNRSLLNVLFGGYGASAGTLKKTDAEVKPGSPSEAAFIMENAGKVIIVPGYGMAVAQAQHALKQMAELLRQKYGVEVKFAIHPVAGRMPGHMNVLLAEAGVPYENIYELNDINHEFATADVAYVIGANDITNPDAKNDSSSPLYGMPILDVALAKTVFVVKRSMAAGYAGLDNPLFYADNTIMLFGDAQKVTGEIVKILEH